MKKRRNILLGIGAVAAVAAPIAVTVSCNSGDNYKNKVLIKYTWSANSVQVAALRAVTDYYNSHVVKDGDFKIVLKKVEGGYGDAVKNDLSDISHNHFGPVADLVIDYPDSVGRLQEFALDFGATQPDLYKRFEEKFVKNNIEGQKTTASSLFAVPLAKSAEMISISIPVLKYLVEQGAVEFGTSLTGETARLKKAVDDYKDGDKADVAAKWGTISSGATKITIDDNTFTNYDKFLKMSSDIAGMFANVKFDGKNQSAKVLGHDAPVNLVYQLFNARVNYDINKFLFHKGSAANGAYDYTGVTSKTSDGGKIFNDILQKLVGYMSGAGLTLNGAGSYSSKDFIDHYYAWTMGSTAGYYHNFEGASSVAIKTGGETHRLGQHDKQIVAASKSVESAHPGVIGMTADRHHNPVFPSTYTGKLGKYDVKLMTPAGDKMVTDNIKNDKKIIVLTGAKKIGTATGIKEYTYSGHDSYLYVGEKVTVAATNNPKKVGEDELFVTMAPIHSGPATKAQILGQGPSIIGVKHGGKKDEQSSKFLAWLFDPASTITTKDNAQPINPIKYFDSVAGYITGFKGAFDTKNRNTFANNRGTLVAFDTFAKMVSLKDNGIIFDNPLSLHSGDVRNALATNFKSVTASFTTGKPVTADKVYEKVTKTISSVVNG